MKKLSESLTKEIRLMGEDECSERRTDILDKKTTAEERAKELLGLK